MKTFVTALLVALGLLLPTAGNASVARSTSPDALVTTVSIPVLCYHVVSTNPSGRYQLSVAKFQEQMAYLASNGFTTLSMDLLNPRVGDGLCLITLVPLSLRHLPGIALRLARTQLTRPLRGLRRAWAEAAS
jgi:hypothetical protein